MYEDDDVKNLLLRRGLLRQYLKVVGFLKAGTSQKLDFKERKPKGSGIYSFRINKQFRAFWYFDSDHDLIVYEINNHQN